MKHIFTNHKIFRINYRNDINGLRAIAVISVVLYHAGYEQFNGGWLGVDIFFVISGYLISNIILSELHKGDFSFKTFYMRRVKRILPALFSTLVFTAPISYWLLTPKGMTEYLESVFASIFFYANYFFQNLDFYTAEPTKYMPLLHTWSLAIEEQFYLIFPLLCFIIYKIFKKYTFLFLSIVFLYSIFLNSTTGDLIKFYQLQFRAWELILGALIMIISQKLKFKNIEKLGFVIILFSIIYFDDQMITINSFEPKALVNLGTAFILLSKNNSGIIFNALSNNISTFFGKISYSLYLFHQPFYAFILIYQKKYSLNLSDNLDFLIILFLIFLSFLNWKFVEELFLKSEFKKVVIFLTSCLLILLSFIYLGKQSDGYRERYSYVPDQILFYSTNTNLFSTQEDIDSFNQYCEGKGDKEYLYVIGDSHVNNFSYTLINNYKSLSCDYELKIYSSSAGRCLLSMQSDIVGYVGWCADETFQNFITQLKNDSSTVVLFGRFDTWLDENKGGKEIKCENCNFTDVFSYRLSKIIENSKKTIVITPVPTYSENIAESYLYKKYVWGDEITLDKSKWDDYIKKTKEYLISSSKENTFFLNSEEVFCNTSLNKCFASKDNQIFYTDNNHLSIEGSELLIEEIIFMLNN